MERQKRHKHAVNVRAFTQLGPTSLRSQQERRPQRRGEELWKHENHTIRVFHLTDLTWLVSNDSTVKSNNAHLDFYIITEPSDKYFILSKIFGQVNFYCWFVFVRCFGTKCQNS